MFFITYLSLTGIRLTPCHDSAYENRLEGIKLKKNGKKNNRYCSYYFSRNKGSN